MRRTHNFRLVVSLFIFAISCLYSLYSISTVNAYVVEGRKWSSGNPDYGYDTSISSQNNGAWVGRLSNAVAEWNSISQSNNWAFWYKYDNSSINRVRSANIAAVPACASVGPTPCLALTDMYPGSTSTTYSKFILTINTGSGYAFYDGSQASYLPSNYYDLRTVFRHELGHALGLCHANNDSTAVMWYKITIGTVKQIGPDDRNGLRYIYWPGYNSTSPSGDCYGTPG